MKHWYTHAKPARSIVPFSRFVGDSNVFALKHGGYGCMFALAGVDEEGLSDAALQSVTDRIHDTVRALGTECRIYEYMRVRQGYEMPRQDSYPSEAAESFVSDRITFLHGRGLRRVGLFWCLTAEPSSGPRHTPAAQARRSTRDLATLDKSAELLQANLGELLGLVRLDRSGVMAFFGYLLGLEEWCDDQAFGPYGAIDRSLALSPAEWHADHLRVGKQYVQMFTLAGAPALARPNLLGTLQSLDIGLIICASWSPKAAADVRKRVGEIEGFLGVFRHRALSLLAHLQDQNKEEKIEKTVRAKAADKGGDKLAAVLSAVDNEGVDHGRYSLTVLAHSRDRDVLGAAIPQIHRALIEAQIPYLEETVGNLAAYYAMFPGNSSGDAMSDFNVRRCWLRGDEHATLALAYAPATGSRVSQDLDAEYLSVYETRAKTPYFLDPYTGGMRTTLILGSPRSGKSMNGNHILAHEQKYGGYSYVFDVGGSYESTVRLFGGAVERVGLDHPRINPFTLKPTDDNKQFLFGFLRLLLVSGGAKLGPDDEQDILRAISRMYLLAPEVRRMGSLLFALPQHLQRYMTKWVVGGVYGKTFDNVDDGLELQRIQVFDFESVSETQKDLLEPLLFWILHRIGSVMHDPGNLGVPKHLLFDELFKHLGNRQLLEAVLDALKTGGKHLAGATLLTQSASDLGPHADLIINACSTFLFLPDPTFNREQYQRLFNLNDQEVLNLAGLRPREALLKRAEFSKIIALNLDDKSYSLFSTRPKDKVRRLKGLRIERTA